MVRKIQNLLLTTILAIVFSIGAMADQPPDPGGGPGSGDDPVGGGSPVGSGLVIMLVMGAGYAAKKAFNMHKS
ncbi:MAG: hypothetical protein JW731_13170 [Bacteroidales bacterium]|nr:hypothetical protein [Bacteroidales bacterium]